MKCKALWLKKGALLLLSVSMLNACKKNDKQDSTPQVPSAKVALLISSPGTEELIFFKNGNKTTTSTLLTYNTVNNYSSMDPGKGEFSFATKKDSTKILTKINYDMKTDASYTLLFTGKVGQNALILVEDDLSAPATDQAKIRFANLSPDAPALDLYFQGQTETTISNKSFMDVSAYYQVKPASKAKFEIKENGKSAVLAELSTFKIEKGKIYTIWARGLLNPVAGANLGLDAMTNK